MVYSVAFLFQCFILDIDDSMASLWIMYVLQPIREPSSAGATFDHDWRAVWHSQQVCMRLYPSLDPLPLNQSPLHHDTLFPCVLSLTAISR